MVGGEPHNGLSIDERLREWATPRQIEYIDKIHECGSARAAARALGVDKSSITDAISRLKKYAATKGYSPDHDMTRTVPEPFVIKGLTTCYRRGEPEPVLQWVKTTVDRERQAEMMKAAAEAMAEELPRTLPLPLPLHTQSHLLNLYTFTDCHVGMLAWGKESGADWDLTIAERTLVGCFEQMIAASPAAKVCVVNQLGDFMHYDGLSAVTPTHGHILDADGRFSKMVGVAIRILRRIIEVALLRHETVHVLMAEGNHDMASSVWLRHMFKALYENEPRVIVNDSELPYYAIQHGNTMLGFHHGHLSKMAALPLLFASQYPVMWGATTKRFGHTGHRHHKDEKEYPGMDILQHATMAARDAYAARGGWIAERAATAITYSDVFGQVGTVTVTPEMLG